MSTYLVDRGSAYPPTGSRLIARKLTELKSRAAQFSDDTAGSIMVLFGLMALGMFALMGVAIDMGRWLNARDQTVAATDAAVLAAGRALQTNGGDQNAALAVARTFYQQGVKDRLKVSSDTINFVVTDLGAAVKVTGNAEISTPFMGLIKIKSLPLMRNSGADYAKAVIASGRYENEFREVSLMLDVSGSMRGQKLTDLKKAAKDFIDIVVPANKGMGAKSKIALVPFSDDVRPPVSFTSSVMNAIAPGPASYDVSRGGKKKGKGKKKTYYRSACVVERAGTEKYKDTMASAANPLLRNYTSSGSCSTPAGAEVVPRNDALAREQAHGPINRRERNARVDGVHTPIDLIHVRVIGGFGEHAGDHAPRCSHTQALLGAKLFDPAGLLWGLFGHADVSPSDATGRRVALRGPQQSDASDQRLKDRGPHVWPYRSAAPWRPQAVAGSSAPLDNV